MIKICDLNNDKVEELKNVLSARAISRINSDSILKCADVILDENALIQHDGRKKFVVIKYGNNLIKLYQDCFQNIEIW